MDHTPKQNLINESQRTRKAWKEPQLYIISQANVAGGNVLSVHEKNFTPNHTRYMTPLGDITPAINTPGGAPNPGFPTTKFNNYQS